MVAREIPPLLGAPAPDWTNADDYPDPSSTSMEEWAEAFMRRNPVFKQALAELEAFARNALDEVPSPELLDQLKTTVSGAVAGLIQEFYPKPWTDRIRPTMTRSQESPDTEHSFAPTLSEADVVVRFNLEYPIAPQLEATKLLLEEKREALVRAGEIAPVKNRRLVTKVQKYRLYLRLLDAEAAGAGISRMAAVLFADKPNEHPDYEGSRAVQDNLKAAKKLRDGEYRNLTLTEK